MKSLWLYNHRKDLIPETPPSKQMIFDQGHAVGALAQTRFPGGRLISEGREELDRALTETRAAVSGGAKVLYEGTVLYDGVLIRADILVRNKDDSWDLVEVKGSSEVKDVHLPDLAIQRYVLEGAGFKVTRTILMHINTDYVRRGDIDVNALFILADVTQEAAALLQDVPDSVRSFHEIVAQRDAPAIAIGPRCNDPYDCEFIPYCWRDVPEYSIYDLVRLRNDKILMLRDRDILEIKDIPDDFPLSTSQQLQVLVEKSGKAHIDAKAIAKLLKTLDHPLHFLDFETVNPAIPPYDGLRPFQQLPFQASVHVQKGAGAPMEHFEHVGDGKGDPRPGLASFLADAIGPKGSVVAYNASFEGQRLQELADAFKEQSKRLLSAKARLWDVAEPFRKSLYVHPGFRGRWSIKAVLPALAPDLNYKGLAIQDGSQAQLAYLNLMHGEPSEAERGKVVEDLKAYCGQDTLGMVRLLDRLKQDCSAS